MYPVFAKECDAAVSVDSPLSCSLESPEQAVGSPFTDPGSMETLNILNQNYERWVRRMFSQFSLLLLVLQVDSWQIILGVRKCDQSGDGLSKNTEIQLLPA